MVKQYSEMTNEELLSLKAELDKEYADYKAMGLKLNMSRGKPCDAQVEMSMGIMDALDSKSELYAEDGTDCRNYGVLEGIPEIKKLMGDMVGVDAKNVIVYGNSSLNIMYDTVARCFLHGVMGSTPWCKLEKVKFLCPAPGYDRHFGVTESFGCELITVPMTPAGPDMDVVEKLVSEDESVKGIWCVPKYSNPEGYSYSDETVKRLAALKPKAADFRLFWDNAYCMHEIYYDRSDSVLEILSECEKAGNPDMVYEFMSTSKIGFPGSGVAAIASSEANLNDIRKYLQFQTIGYDKINQLRHVRYFKNIDGMKAHMVKHAEIIRPKFDLVAKVFDEELSGLGIGKWTTPAGGYFMSFDAIDGCAKAIVARCKEAGVIMTGAGATYPYGKDPCDKNIRIAPTFPTLEELGIAAKLFCLCVKLVSVEKYLA
ncbi:MAG: aminotransferase class I/II-fold pyridoxal phosphate-dependent enzyme [Ruminococcaceae bacterium]|nr:aminotransferase class I/II-fold pyridoxal phosphate-dependent enzyme [Oscillospiraceae bacterium]